MTVFSHIYNEEYLLPWWLEHHTKIFDHGVFIDYGSTDRSIEIIKEMAPTWEVIPSRVVAFDAYNADLQIMEQERRFTGWKIALNTTEFLFHRNINEFKEIQTPSAFSCTGAYLIDPFELFNVEPDPSLPLLKQRTFGMYERDGIVPGYVHARCRLFHNHVDGAYHLGRHVSSHRNAQLSDLLCVWTGYCPMTPKGLERKLQIRGKIPQEQLAAGGGIAHPATLQDALAGTFGWLAYANKIQNLLNDTTYKDIWDKWYGN